MMPPFLGRICPYQFDETAHRNVRLVRACRIPKSPGGRPRHGHGGLLAPGDSVRVQVAAPVQLGNQGGLITLLNPDGLKVDGVAYTQAQAAAEGWSIVF
jgi:hypothetical protein